MDNVFYASLTRQSGLLREMQTVANNISNMSTTGFRREGIVFSEFVEDTGEASLSMVAARTRHPDMTQGTLNQTKGQLDFAIDGGGFFLIETPDGQELTRAGSFSTNEVGDVVTAEGFRLLDAGGAPLNVPPDVSGIVMSSDGTLSADGQPIGQLGLWQPVDPMSMTKTAGTRFRPEEVEPTLEGGAILQGFVEGSNVDPVLEMARMVEVSRAYEVGQSFLDKEDERIRNVIKTLGRS